MKNADQKYSREYLEYAHIGCSSHKAEIQTSSLGGCFYCLDTFDAAEIIEWIKEPNGGETAICPMCGIDSVLSSKYPITDPIFLYEMNVYWF